MLIRFPESVGLNHLNYELPDSPTQINEVDTTSKKLVLKDFGYEQVWKSGDIYELAYKSAMATMTTSHIAPSDITRVYLASGLPDIVTANEDKRLDIFEYPLSQLQLKLGLQQSSGIAVSQRGCSSFMIGLQQAILSLSASEETCALCIAADAWPYQNREVMYNLISDAAASVMVQKHPQGSYFQPILVNEYTHSYYCSPQTQEQELLAAYFPIAHRTITSCLESANLDMNDIAWIVPHNVNLNSWKILSSMLDIPLDKVWLENISRVGHTISCDQIINTKDMLDSQVVKDKDYLLWFTFGFGASWLAMIVQYHE